MKRILLLLLGIFSSTALIAQFQGEINMTSTSKDGLNATFLIKGEQVKMTINQNGSLLEMYSDTKTGEVLTVTQQGSRKIGMQQNMNDPIYAQTMNRYKNMDLAEGAYNNQDIEIEVSNSMVQHNGFTCQMVNASSSEMKGEALITKDIDLNLYDLFPLLKSYEARQDPMEKALGVEGFLIKLTSTNLRTSETMVIENQVKNRNVSKEEITVGSDVELMDMSNLMEQYKEVMNDPEKRAEYQKMMRSLNGQ